MAQKAVKNEFAQRWRRVTPSPNTQTHHLLVLLTVGYGVVLPSQYVVMCVFFYDPGIRPVMMWYSGWVGVDGSEFVLTKGSWIKKESKNID